MTKPQSVLEQLHALHAPMNTVADVLGALSEVEIVRRALVLANNATGEEKAEAIVGLMGMLSHGFSEGQVKALSVHWKASKSQRQLDEWWEGLADDRAQFRAHIELAYTDPGKARAQLNSQMQAAVKNMVIVPRLTWTGDRLVTELRYWALETSALLGYVLMLLLDRDRDLVSSLRRCKLETCDRFFLSLPSESGGRPPLYCNPYHKTDAANASAAERMRQMRAKRARKAK